MELPDHPQKNTSWKTNRKCWSNGFNAEVFSAKSDEKIIMNTEKIRISRATNHRLITAEVWAQSDGILVGFFVDKLALGHVFLRELRFPSCQLSFHRFSVLIYLQELIQVHRRRQYQGAQSRFEVCLLLNVAVITDTLQR